LESEKDNQRMRENMHNKVVAIEHIETHNNKKNSVGKQLKRHFKNSGVQIANVYM
jgi:hypothetical protein